jgi:hypothetical protein
MKSLEFEKVSFADARKALDGPPKGEDKAKAKETTFVRRGPDVTPVLFDATVAWMNALPPAARPTGLAQRFPRIANGIAERWPSVDRCEQYLDSLLVDQRGDRKGFPMAVALEVASLRSYYTELHPRAQSAWDSVERSK